MKSKNHSLRLWIVAVCVGFLPSVSLFAQTPYTDNLPDPTTDKAAYIQFMQRECPQAYKQYKQGNECIIAGWTLLGAGLVGAPISAVYGFVGAYGNSATPDARPSAASVACVSVFALSSAMVISSVPLLSVGYHLKGKSVKTLNQQCRRPPLELSLQMTGTNLGFALSF